MVTGKVRKDEKAYKAAIREIKEETYLSVNDLYVVPHVNSFYNEKDDTVNLIPVFAAVVNSRNINEIHQQS